MSISFQPGSALPSSTVLIIDDHDLVATSLAISLRSVGLQARQQAVRSREDVLLATAALPPGVVVLDLDLGREPDGTLIDGTTLIEGLRAAGWRVLVLSGTADQSRIGKALAAGALAGVSKSAGLPVLVAAIRRAVQGAEVMHPHRRQQYIEAYQRRVEQQHALRRRLERLSDRERAVLDRLVRGQRAQLIADEFRVSIATVRTQIRSVLAKLEVGSQLEAVVLVNEHLRAGGNEAE